MDEVDQEDEDLMKKTRRRSYYGSPGLTLIYVSLFIYIPRLNNNLYTYLLGPFDKTRARG